MRFGVQEQKPQKPEMLMDFDDDEDSFNAIQQILNPDIEDDEAYARVLQAIYDKDNSEYEDIPKKKFKSDSSQPKHDTISFVEPEFPYRHLSYGNNLSSQQSSAQSRSNHMERNRKLNQRKNELQNLLPSNKRQHYISRFGKLEDNLILQKCASTMLREENIQNLFQNLKRIEKRIEDIHNMDFRLITERQIEGMRALFLQQIENEFSKNRPLNLQLTSILAPFSEDTKLLITRNVLLVLSAIANSDSLTIDMKGVAAKLKAYIMSGRIDNLRVEELFGIRKNVLLAIIEKSCAGILEKEDDFEAFTDSQSMLMHFMQTEQILNEQSSESIKSAFLCAIGDFSKIATEKSNRISKSCIINAANLLANANEFWIVLQQIQGDKSSPFDVALHNLNRLICFMKLKLMVEKSEEMLRQMKKEMSGMFASESQLIYESQEDESLHFIKYQRILDYILLTFKEKLLPQLVSRACNKFSRSEPSLKISIEQIIASNVSQALPEMSFETKENHTTRLLIQYGLLNLKSEVNILRDSITQWSEYFLSFSEKFESLSHSAAPMVLFVELTSELIMRGIRESKKDQIVLKEYVCHVRHFWELNFYPLREIVELNLKYLPAFGFILPASPSSSSLASSSSSLSCMQEPQENINNNNNHIESENQTYWISNRNNSALKGHLAFESKERGDHLLIWMIKNQRAFRYVIAVFLSYHFERIRRLKSWIINPKTEMNSYQFKSYVLAFQAQINEFEAFFALPTKIKQLIEEDVIIKKYLRIERRHEGYSVVSEGQREWIGLHVNSKVRVQHYLDRTQNFIVRLQIATQEGEFVLNLSDEEVASSNREEENLVIHSMIAMMVFNNRLKEVFDSDEKLFSILLFALVSYCCCERKKVDNDDEDNNINVIMVRKIDSPFNVAFDTQFMVGFSEYFNGGEFIGLLRSKAVENQLVEEEKKKKRERSSANDHGNDAFENTIELDSLVGGDTFVEEESIVHNDQSFITGLSSHVNNKQALASVVQQNPSRMFASSFASSSCSSSVRVDQQNSSQCDLESIIEELDQRDHGYMKHKELRFKMPLIRMRNQQSQQQPLLQSSLVKNEKFLMELKRLQEEYEEKLGNLLLENDAEVVVAEQPEDLEESKSHQKDDIRIEQQAGNVELEDSVPTRMGDSFVTDLPPDIPSNMEEEDNQDKRVESLNNQQQIEDDSREKITEIKLENPNVEQQQQQLQEVRENDNQSKMVSEEQEEEQQQQVVEKQEEIKEGEINSQAERSQVISEEYLKELFQKGKEEVLEQTRKRKLLEQQRAHLESSQKMSTQNELNVKNEEGEEQPIQLKKEDDDETVNDEDTIPDCD